MSGPAGFDTRRPPPWVYGDTWDERAANVIAGFTEMPDPGALTGYAQMCGDIKHAPASIRERVRAAFNARLAILEQVYPSLGKKTA